MCYKQFRANLFKTKSDNLKNRKDVSRLKANFYCDIIGKNKTVRKVMLQLQKNNWEAYGEESDSTSSEDYSKYFYRPLKIKKNNYTNKNHSPNNEKVFENGILEENNPSYWEKGKIKKEKENEKLSLLEELEDTENLVGNYSSSDECDCEENRGKNRFTCISDDGESGVISQYDGNTDDDIGTVQPAEKKLPHDCEESEDVASICENEPQDPFSHEEYLNIEEKEAEEKNEPGEVLDRTSNERQSILDEEFTRTQEEVEDEAEKELQLIERIENLKTEIENLKLKLAEAKQDVEELKQSVTLPGHSCTAAQPCSVAALVEQRLRARREAAAMSYCQGLYQVEKMVTQEITRLEQDMQKLQPLNQLAADWEIPQDPKMRSIMYKQDYMLVASDVNLNIPDELKAFITAMN